MPPDPDEPQPDRFAKLVTSTLNVAWRIARRSGVQPSSLDDVLQETFMVVSRRLSDIEPGRERAFVATATLKVAANFRRAQQRRQEEAHGSLDHLSNDHRAPVQEVSAERSQGLELLNVALSTMTESQREVFILTELEQLTASEVAESLGIAEAAVVSRLRRSREAFETFCRKRQGLPPKRSHRGASCA